MKRCYIILFFLLCLLPMKAFAGDYDDFTYEGYKYLTTLDDVGHVISGSYYTEVNIHNSTQNKDWFYKDLYNLSVSEGGYVYGVQQSNGYIYFYGSGELKVSHYSCSYVDNEYNTTSCSTSTYFLNNYYTNQNKASYLDYSEAGFLKIHANDTCVLYVMDSIPIFDSSDDNFTEYVEAYINEGDYSNATNADDIEIEPPVDENIKVPQNLRTYRKLANLYKYANSNGLKNQVVVRWDIEEDWINSYSYDVQVRFYSSISNGEYSWGGWKSYVSDYPYNGDELIDIDTGEVVQRTTSRPETFYFNLTNLANYYGMSTTDFVTTVDYLNAFECCDMEVRVRNRCGDNSSNWVTVSLNNLTDGVATANVTDSDGNVIDSDEYYGQNVDNTNHDTYYDTDSDYYNNVAANDLSLNSIMSYIKNGFGLLGSDGLLALMSKTFSYLPASIWTILNFFVSILVVIALIAIVKKLVF